MTATLDGPCAVGIGLLLGCTIGLFVVGTWPAFFLSVLRLSPSAQARVRRAITRTSIGLILGATGGLLVILVSRPC